MDTRNTSKEELLQQAKAWLKCNVCNGYEIALYLTNGERICQKCALENWRLIVSDTLHPDYRANWGILALEVYWEGPTVICQDCGKVFESEYGNPFNTEEA